MKLLIAIIIFMTLTSCAATRAIVKDCKDAGNNLYNCELVMKV
jgi:hypothetical protein